MPLLPAVIALRPQFPNEVRVLSRAKLPTQHGPFEIVAFARPNGEQLRDIALVRGDLSGACDVPMRIHSECLTGDVLGSVRCDCGEQLQLALERMAASEYGIILYLRQEGRGIGIANKVRAYALQDEGMDTVDANLHLGFDDDLRTYDTAAAMLRALEVESVVLHTNNPRKLQGLRDGGVSVKRREPLAVPPRVENRHYLETKRRRSGHLLEFDVE